MVIRSSSKNFPKSIMQDLKVIVLCRGVVSLKKRLPKSLPVILSQKFLEHYFCFIYHDCIIFLIFTLLGTFLCGIQL